MNREDILASIAMGFLLGLAAFGGLSIRLRQWSADRTSAPPSSLATGDDRHLRMQPTTPAWFSLRDLAEHLFTLDRWVDLVGVGFIVIMLGYGAIVAPRLRYILFVAILTVVMAWWVMRLVMRWLGGGQST